MSDLLAMIDGIKPPAPPGAVYANNPINYLVGLIVQRVSERPALRLSRAAHLPAARNESHVLSGRQRNRHARHRLHPKPAGIRGGADMGSGSARRRLRIVSTIYDLAKWDIEMPVLLRVDSVRTMFTPSASQGATRYGMGWVIDRRGGKRFVWSNGEFPAIAR